ncbi:MULTISPECIES: pilus assembly protein PilP [unclassified Uliginosibacterium]|uniref:pilus assembly protein PilP n=1 Tax=unclassified Uliginosibacterium TaxID=2621521 RepID=UPI0020B14ABB|nr:MULTISPECIES: pilus assembly protein PilP [unclassified Uliginosibacterium]MDO6388224.1 pilus assembly protein PilP [Uliginosibacterium sp. 31-12]
MKKIMKPVWLILSFALLLSACSSDEHQDLRAWMANETQGMQGKIQPLPKLTQFPVVEYEVVGQVDPFQASRLEPEKRGGKASPRNDTRRREPLESYPLETLNMVGMMLMNGKPVALVKADKTIHQVRAGNYLGQNFGVVTKITENDLTLKELIEDANGDWIERFSTMQLQEQETKK